MNLFLGADVIISERRKEIAERNRKEEFKVRSGSLSESIQREKEFMMLG